MSNLSWQSNHVYWIALHLQDLIANGGPHTRWCMTKFPLSTWTKAADGHLIEHWLNQLRHPFIMMPTVVFSCMESQNSTCNKREHRSCICDLSALSALISCQEPQNMPYVSKIWIISLGQPHSSVTSRGLEACSICTQVPYTHKILLQWNLLIFSKGEWVCSIPFPPIRPLSSSHWTEFARVSTYSNP